MPIARKDYICFLCEEPIEKGELYVRLKVQTYSKKEGKVGLADICLHDGCYYDDCFRENQIIWEKLNDDPDDDRIIIDIVKAPVRI
ncbi:hypothetical protein [Desulfurobacterium crinifex]